MKYQIHKGSKYYGATTVFENIQFEIRNTEKIAIVGRNGCGKTTLLRVIAETEVLDAGEIHKENKLRIGYLAQTTFTDENVIVEEEMEQAFEQVKAVGKRLEELSEKMCSDHSEAVLNAYADVQQRFEELGGYTYRSEMMTIFYKIRISGGRPETPDFHVFRWSENTAGICEAAAEQAGCPVAG